MHENFFRVGTWRQWYESYFCENKNVSTIRNFASNFYVVSAVSGHFFSQPLLLTGLSYRSGSQLDGKLRSFFKTKVICTFALELLIFPQYGVKVMYCCRVYYIKVCLHCEPISGPRAIDFSFRETSLLSKSCESLLNLSPLKSYGYKRSVQHTCYT